jgi:hypothetical protein
MELSTIIISWNTRDLLRECLASLREFMPAENGAHEIIVVDNASEDDSAKIVADDFPEVILIRNNENMGFGRAVNKALEAARGEFVFLLNSDARLINKAPLAMINFLKQNLSAGIVGPRLVTPEGESQLSYGDFPSPWWFLCERIGLKKWVPARYAPQLGRIADENMKEPAPIEYVSGAAPVMRRSVLDKLGGFDPGYRLYFEETDLCYRAHKAGIGVYLLPQVSVVHHLGKSLLTREDRDKLQARLIFMESEIRFLAKNYSTFWGWFAKTYYIWHYGRHFISQKIKGKKKKAEISRRYLEHLKTLPYRVKQ